MSDAGSSFGKDASAYERFRPNYPEEVYSPLLELLGPQTENCIELGAGTGKATRALAKHFTIVNAVEPDERMLAQIPDTAGIKRHNLASEEASFPSGSADAVVCATSFHWMDQARVLKLAYNWLKPNGVFYAFLYGPWELEGATKLIVSKHRRLWGPFKDKSVGAKANYATPIESNRGFQDIKGHKFEMTLELSPHDTAALFLTASFVALYAQTTIGVSAYHAQLAQELAEVSEHKISVRIPLGGVSAIRKDQKT